VPSTLCVVQAVPLPFHGKEMLLSQSGVHYGKEYKARVQETEIKLSKWVCGCAKMLTWRSSVLRTCLMESTPVCNGTRLELHSIVSCISFVLRVGLFATDVQICLGGQADVHRYHAVLSSCASCMTV
jgi:hypothetical protein